jgi:hypothetical protein
VDAPVALRRQVFMIDSGEQVCDVEHYFRVEVDSSAVSDAGWTAYEKSCMTAYRWWSRLDLAQTTEMVWPQDLTALLDTNRKHKVVD